MRIAYSSAANRDVKSALDYYKRKAGAKVAGDFIDQLESKAAKIQKSPESYRMVVKDLRCANLDRFPYQILYRIAGPSLIKIISVRHHKQRLDFGLNR
ncbi:MAG: type II toxin-antitoxin system RelE/ParE family toxin [Pyrinomonadaceae bacterium]